MPLDPLPADYTEEGTPWDGSGSCSLGQAEALNALGIPHPSLAGDMAYTAYETPSYSLPYLRPALREIATDVANRALNHLPNQYHAVVNAAVKDAITDTACTIYNHVTLVDDSHNELWGLHLNLWGTQTRNHVMSDAQAQQTTTEANTAVVAAINVIRDDVRSQFADGKHTVATAVDAAIVGTVIVLEESFASGGIATVQGLSESLASSWADTVNS